MPVDGEVWHYTTAAGLIGIVSERVLRASSAAFMNDHREIHTGREVWNSRLEKEVLDLVDLSADSMRNLGSVPTSDSPSDVYVACACRDGNNLTMWRNYTGDEVGFAIQLDPRQPLFLRLQRRAEDIIFPSDRELLTKERSLQDVAAFFNELLIKMARPLEWEDAIYDSERQNAIMDEAIEKLKEFSNAGKLADSLVQEFFEHMASLEKHLQLFKNEAFVDERERRVVCTVRHSYLKRGFIKHRPGRYGVVPFIELGIPDGPLDLQADPKKPQAVQRLPIRRVIVGPTPYPEAARRSAQDLLGTFGYGDVTVDSSDIPFRR